MRGYLVDPQRREVLPIQMDERDVSDILSSPRVEHSWINRDGLYVGDEASRYSFELRDADGVFVGRGIVLGHTEDGDICDAKGPIEAYRPFVWRS